MQSKWNSKAKKQKQKKHPSAFLVLKIGFNAPCSPFRESRKMALRLVNMEAGTKRAKLTGRYSTKDLVAIYNTKRNKVKKT